MKQYIRYVLRPVDNRHYTGKRRAFLQETIRYSPLFVICMVCMVVVDFQFFGILLVLIGIAMLVDFFVFDAITDRLLWRFLYRRWYGRDLHISEEHKLMKELEKSGDIEAYKRSSTKR